MNINIMIVMTITIKYSISMNDIVNHTLTLELKFMVISRQKQS